ncbi:hypothetical protein B0H16DRAFT_553484 [Mycena metata]|uniref:Nephrocystin 3-like N-terminal domain-containing protein n=1 Tax=Mycena metata TaxID=1033252 RepID=A0AAD7MEI5_9AGAR|nr:hypothetical protein B0H16DRAFT_553484 [Mycena metata]
MYSQGNEVKTFGAKISISGGRGGSGGDAYGIGGEGGKGEGPQVTIVNQGQGLEQVLYKWLESPPTTKDRQHELQKLRHEVTGSWFLGDSQFIKWKTTASSLWIKGISGTGKSVLRWFI